MVSKLAGHISVAAFAVFVYFATVITGVWFAHGSQVFGPTFDQSLDVCTTHYADFYDTTKYLVEYDHPRSILRCLQYEQRPHRIDLDFIIAMAYAHLVIILFFSAVVLLLEYLFGDFVSTCTPTMIAFVSQKARAFATYAKDTIRAFVGFFKSPTMPDANQDEMEILKQQLTTALKRIATLEDQALGVI